MKFTNFNQLSYFTYDQLINNNVHLGDSIGRKTWFEENYFFIKGTFNGHFILSLDLTVQTTRKSLFLVENNVNKRLKVLLASHNFIVAPRVRSECLYLSKYGCYFTSKRWVGGILTNFKILAIRIFPFLERLHTIPSEKLRVRVLKKWRRLLKLLEGLSGARILPSFVFGTSLNINPWIFREAFNLLIPSAGLIDSNCPYVSLVTYGIASNDDSIKSLLFFLLLFKNSFMIGRLKRKRKFLSILNLSLLLLREQNLHYNFISLIVSFCFLKKINRRLFRRI